MRFLRTSVWIVLIGAFLIVGVLFWPANLGGRTTYVSTHGTSMLPRFHAGDLAIVQRSSHYRVGDITAYHSATLHTIVLHRIIAVHNGHFAFKGDNNNFVDPDHPTVDQLVGRLVARVPHAGETLTMVARPIVLFPLLALIFGGFALGSGGSPRKRSKQSPRAPAPAHPKSRNRRLGEHANVVLATGALAVVAALVFAASAWTSPGTETASVSLPYRQTATIGYSGRVTRGAVYPDGQVHSGDPIFTKLISAITINLHYAFEIDGVALHALRGTSEVVADVSSQTGWQRELVLAPARAFTGDDVKATTRLDLRALQHMERAFTAETGLDTPDVSLQVTWKLHVGGDVSGSPLSTDLAPALAFQASPVELLPATPTATPGQGASAPSVIKTGSAATPATRARTFGLGPIRLSDAFARILSILLVVLILATTAFVLAFDRRRAEKDVATAILARYRFLLVRVDTIPVAGRRPLVQVDTMRDLVRLAKLHDELIVHAEESSRHRFALFTDAVVYHVAVDSVAPLGSRGAAATEPAIANAGHDLAKWALAGLEACAAERRGAPPHPDSQLRADSGAPMN